MSVGIRSITGRTGVMSSGMPSGMSEGIRSITRRPGGTSGGGSRSDSGRCSRKQYRPVVPGCDGRTDVEHPIDLAAGHAEGGGRIGRAVELFTVGTDPRVGACTQRASAAGRALRRDEALLGVRVPAGEHCGEVLALHDTDQSGASRGSALPPAGLFPAICVVPLRPPS